MNEQQAETWKFPVVGAQDTNCFMCANDWRPCLSCAGHSYTILSILCDCTLFVAQDTGNAGMRAYRIHSAPFKIQNWYPVLSTASQYENRLDYWTRIVKIVHQKILKFKNWPYFINWNKIILRDKITHYFKGIPIKLTVIYSIFYRY
jgi:hypothetical protein